MELKKVFSPLFILALAFAGAVPPFAALRAAEANIIEINVQNKKGELQKQLIRLAEEYTPALISRVSLSGFVYADELPLLRQYLPKLSYIDLSQLQLSPKTIPSYTFAELHDLKYFIYPGELDTIGLAAFKNCRSLSGPDLPPSLKAIHDSAFFNCASFAGSLTIPVHVEHIGASAFEHCGLLTSLTFGAKLRSIGAYAFAGDTLLANELFLPSSLHVIAPGTFFRCGFTGTLRIADYVSVIQGDDFLADDTGVSLPQGKGAFEGCTALQRIELGAGLREIGARAFFGCTGLSGSPALPAGLSYIGPAAFANCTGITRLELPPSLTQLGVYRDRLPDPASGAFAGCSGLAELVIADRLESIAPFSFYACADLQSVTVGKALRAIEDSAFANCPKLHGKVWIVWNPIQLPIDPTATNACEEKRKVFGQTCVLFEEQTSSLPLFFVRHDGTDDTSGDNGHSWQTAYKTLEKAIQESNTALGAHVYMESMGYTATVGSIHFPQGVLSLTGGFTGQEQPDLLPLGNPSSLQLSARPEFAGKPVLILGDPFKVPPVEVNLRNINISGLETRGYLIGNWDNISLANATFNSTAALSGVFSLKGKVDVRQSFILSVGNVTFQDAIVSANAPIALNSLNVVGTVTFDIPVWDPSVERVVLSTWGENLPPTSSFRAILNGGNTSIGQGFHFKWRTDTRLNSKGQLIQYGRQKHLVAISYIPAEKLEITAPTSFLARGASLQLDYKALPASATRPETVSWFSSDTSIIKVDSLTGLASSTGNKLGSVDISAVSELDNQLIGHYTLTVIDLQAVSADSKLIPLDSSLPLFVTTQPSGVISGDVFDWVVEGDGNAWVNWVNDNAGGRYHAFGVQPGEVTLKASLKGNLHSSLPLEGNGNFVVTAISIDDASSKDRLWIEHTLQLQASLNPRVDDDYIVWSSDSLHVADIDPATGLVTPHAPGTTVITAALSKNRAVAVRHTLHVTNLIISSPTTHNLLTGSTLHLAAKLVPKVGSDTTLVWKSSDPDIAAIDPISGLLTGIAPGEVTISASLLSHPQEITSAATFVVIQRPLIHSSLHVDSTLQLPPEILVRNIPQPLTWTSSDTSIAAIDHNARITALAPGQITLSALLPSDTSIAFAFTFHVVRLSIIPHEPLSLPVNLPLQLSYLLEPPNAPALGALRWTSSDTLVAKIDSISGLVSAGTVKGDVRISLFSPDLRFTASVSLAVTDPVEGLFITESRYLMEKGDLHTLNVLMYLDPLSPPQSIPQRELEWFSSHPDIVSVHYGSITALQEGGPVRIYARTTDGQFTSAACEVSVMIFAKDITFSAPASIAPGALHTLTASVLPADATLPTVRWTIDDPSILLKINESDLACSLQAILSGTTTIRIESADGRVIKTHTISVYHNNTAELQPLLTTSPTLAYQYGTLHLSGLLGFHCTVFTLTGQPKASFTVHSHQEYHNLSLPPGVYLLHAHSPSDTPFSLRFVVK
jgi:uncharacterized protein YjdB